VKLYNTLSRSIESFEPSAGQVSIYVCGITPYDTTHIGHAFTYTSADILIRYLESKGLKVRYVQNVTDIDDDILRKANEVGEGWRELGNRWTAHYIQDMQALNVRPPDFLPRATEAIPEIVSIIEDLLDVGVAYESGGNVYFAVDKWSTFGELSKIPRAEMLPIANERGNHPDDPNKSDPLDFVLWQAQAPGEPAWESPWGPGRPGWHIECSTLSTKYLGRTIDIHGGGEDLCFPHHECEIAQVEPITNERPFVHFWMHAAMVYHDGDKMSKSLGNLVWVRELLKKYSADGLRLYLGSHHYRQEWSYDEEDLKRAEENARLLQAAVEIQGGDGDTFNSDEALQEFQRAMEDDLDTPVASESLVNFAEELLEAANAGSSVFEAQQAAREMGGMFGLQLGEGLGGRMVEGWEVHIKRFPSIS
jgi:L-cysteine:1D-myo-inositol 2-amino-2-deoxy-alpha-D-glucopyranoside ligase